MAHRVGLAVAAIRRHASLADPEPSDTGSLRGDVPARPQQMSPGVGEAAAVLICVMADYFTTSVIRSRS